MPSDDNVTRLPDRTMADAQAEFDEAKAAVTEAQPETFAGPGWTGQVVYPDGAPPRVASSDPPPPETMPSPAASEAREDLDDAAAELARRVHGTEPGDDLEPAPGGSRVLVDTDPPDEAPAPNPEAEAAAWRVEAQRQADLAERERTKRAETEAFYAGLQARTLRAEALADALEALAGTVRPLVPRLPVKQREPLYQAHGRALEVLAEYRKAGT